MSMKTGHSVTILLVEDEALIRADLAETLTEAGIEVVEAASADQAIGILESRRDIHVLVTDIEMPGSMNGLKLAAYVRDRWPPVRLIVTSGFAKLSRDDLPAGGRFFPKPVDSRELVRAITG